MKATIEHTVFRVAAFRVTVYPLPNLGTCAMIAIIKPACCYSLYKENEVYIVFLNNAAKSYSVTAHLCFRC